MDLCDLISENPVEACDQLLAMYNERGEIIKSLKAKLDELTHGIPIEKACKEKIYYYETGDAWFQTKFIDGSWIAWNLYRNSYQPITANWLYRFPSQFSQTQEGS